MVARLCFLLFALVRQSMQVLSSSDFACEPRLRLVPMKEDIERVFWQWLQYLVDIFGSREVSYGGIDSNFISKRVADKINRGEPHVPH